MLTEKDLQLLKARGITLEQVNQQLQTFKKGFPFLKIKAAADTQHGISALTPEMEQTAIAAWDAYTQEAHKIVKFVPASGAASRMFKDLFSFIEREETTPQTEAEKTFFQHLPQLACYEELNRTCLRLWGEDIPTLVARQRHKDVVRALLAKDGMNYGLLPKGLLQFHHYAEGVRTPMEEHLVEGALYACDKDRHVNIHFTVSAEHMPLFQQLARESVARLETQLGVTYELSYSIQAPNTDTIAANPDNTPFRDANGDLLFRPGGHGALIWNLNEIEADVIFIKNIDNVVHDRFKEDTVAYKKILAGTLVRAQEQVAAYMRRLDSGNYTMAELLEMLQFVQKRFCCKNPETKTLEDTELAIYLRRKLNRPIRVCGMVKNVGEPGGGPFLVYNPDGTISPQILESSQIDEADETMKSFLKNGTHFNPVDIVCSTKDYKGAAFDLLQYVDKNTGFIAQKSKNGKPLKALELPGLWNGAMSDWNTIFVEVPVSTFNPVKTVNDLFRRQHLDKD
jgi:hypothetical protein